MVFLSCLKNGNFEEISGVKYCLSVQAFRNQSVDFGRGEELTTVNREGFIMKKIISLLLVLMMIMSVPVFAAADYDLSAMTWDELIALRAAIMKEQMSRDEWQEVEVPQGVYKVGEDIPAGHWTVKCKEGDWMCDFAWGETLDPNGHDIAWNGVWDEIVLGSDRKDYDVELKDGMYVVVDMGAAIFTPFTGKAALGFK